MSSPLVVVAGLAVRPLAESAREAGWTVIALDLFGDRDTRQAARGWMPIGRPASLRIDPEAFGRALGQAAVRTGTLGWVAGSGFEDRPDLLDAGASALPLLGMPAARVRPLREPRTFFAVLDRLGLPHPEVRFEPPAPGLAWLFKRSAACGGAHVRPLHDNEAPLPPDGYFQRLQPGRPMSALFLADGRHARIVALNEQLVAGGRHPYAYAGALGPVQAPALEATLADALAGLVPAFGLRGLASLDVIVDEGGQPWLLEVNPRPTATLALHGRAWPGGLLKAHVEALCGRLPETPPRRDGRVRGEQVVRACRPCRIDAATSAALLAGPHGHDVPAGGQTFARDEPVCTVSGQAEDTARARQCLRARAAQVLRSLQPLDESAFEGALA